MRDIVGWKLSMHCVKKDTDDKRIFRRIFVSYPYDAK